MADPLALSAKLFAGRIIHISVEGAGTSDALTRPIASSPLWKELLEVSSTTHKPVTVAEAYDVVTPEGWMEMEDIYTVGDTFEVTARRTTALYEQLRYGTAGPIVQGTPQTPFVRSDRSVKAWVNAQLRNQGGQDHNTLALWCQIWAMEPPAEEKKTQTPGLKIRVLKSTLNTVNWPT